MINEFIKRVISSLVIIPISLVVIIKGSYYFNIFLLILFLISSYEWFNISKKRFYNIYGYLFLILSFYCVYELRFNFGNNFLTILIISIICVLTDIGGYIFGKFFKGPKLTKYSPNKTYSGLIGSFLLPMCFIPFSIYYELYHFDDILKFIIFILIVSATSQFGDILISYFKRVSKVKDTGKIIPGHGGLLDRIDGMLFAFPIAYLLLLFNFLSLK